MGFVVPRNPSFNLRLTPATSAGMHDVLQGEQLASRKMRVKLLQVAADLAASYSGYTPEKRAPHSWGR